MGDTRGIHREYIAPHLHEREDTFADIDPRALRDELRRIVENPSDHGSSRTCYAHAAAVPVYMALRRIYKRDGGYPTLEGIRKALIKELPEREEGWSVLDALSVATRLYRPLQFQELLSEDAVKKAVLDGRPVLAQIRLTEDGWDAFEGHWTCSMDEHGLRHPVLTLDKMREFNTGPVRSNGHGVVLVEVREDSLVFLNSWGKDWGTDGTFAIENWDVLRAMDGPNRFRLRFLDVFWLEKDLRPRERRAFQEAAGNCMQRKLEPPLSPYQRLGPLTVERRYDTPTASSIAKGTQKFLPGWKDIMHAKDATHK
ncbi:hypothetical protein QBC47DRAFT_430835 [Echria macrotheca]|uniref:Peptidase C1A papain C-terminal domain-containing protein n=1 Tax=Echria macrotheca TaxID=438768 RepID=A0AAJ0BB57_9PEZI|nr:hypothetical protein QBC47DRAFT_430835 [Echria macrotheca]